MPQWLIQKTANIDEFEKISGLVFAQLYKSFPASIDIDRKAIANALGATPDNWAQHPMPSGQTAAHVVAHTIGWLAAEGFIRSYGRHPAERVSLTTRGLEAMNAVPDGLNQSVGTTLVSSAESGANLSVLGDLIGGIFGGIAKSISGG